MQIFKDFGVNPVLLLAQIVNFLIILVVLKKFMYKPVLSIIKKRQEEVEKGLENAEEAKKKLLEADEKESQILIRAQEKASKIMADAKLEAQELREKSEESTKKEVERMLLQARQTIDQETKTAEDRLVKKIGGIAIGLLEKSLTGIFGAKEQKQILKKATAQLQKSKSL